MKKEDVYKKVDAMLKRFKKEAGESANRFPMKSEVSFKEWKGKRLYIKVDLTDACDEHHRYECGYIDLSTGKYSSMSVFADVFLSICSETEPER